MTPHMPPWPDLEELEKRLRDTLADLERDKRRGPIARNRVKARTILANSYREDIEKMKQHQLFALTGSLGSPARGWVCDCEATGEGATLSDALRAWGKHVEQAVWGQRE